MTLRASIVVPTCGRPELLSRCLEALLAQDFDPHAYEVIVVDDGRGDETRRVVESRRVDSGRRGTKVRYISNGPGSGPAAARNAGWRAAGGTIVAFTDDDCVPSSSWLARGLDVFVDGVTAASGKIAMPLPELPSDYERNASRIENAEFVTANCFCRREALAAVGGFDERFLLPWREDTDLFFALMERGSRFGHAAHALVVHPVRRAPWGISLAQQRKSSFNALLYKKHPDLYRQHLDPPSRRYYLVVGASLASVSSALARRRALALSFASVWIVLTAHFCLERLRGTSRTPRHRLEMIVTSILIPPLALFWRIHGAVKFRVLFL